MKTSEKSELSVPFGPISKAEDGQMPAVLDAERRAPWRRRGERSVLVDAHQPRKAGDISGENRG
jgi:hypothetical protein